MKGRYLETIKTNFRFGHAHKKKSTKNTSKQISWKSTDILGGIVEIMQLPIEEERLDDLDMDHLLRLKAVSESQVSEQQWSEMGEEL